MARDQERLLKEIFVQCPARSRRIIMGKYVYMGVVKEVNGSVLCVIWRPFEHLMLIWDF